MRRTECQQDFEFGSESGVADRGGTDKECFCFGSECAELLLDSGSWPGTAMGRGSGTAVVGVDYRSGARLTQVVFGDDLTGGRLDDHQPSLGLDEGDRRADQPDGHRVARGREPHAGQAVDFTGDRWWTDLQS